MTRYDRLKAEVLRLRQEHKIGDRLSPEERADWAYGTTVMENSAATRAMASDAAEETK